jgi:hypothetical protein
MTLSDEAYAPFTVSGDYDVRFIRVNKKCMGNFWVRVKRLVRSHGLELRASSLGFWVKGTGGRVQGAEFRGSGFRV